MERLNSGKHSVLWITDTSEFEVSELKENRNVRNLDINMDDRVISLRDIEPRFPNVEILRIRSFGGGIDYVPKSVRQLNLDFFSSVDITESGSGLKLLRLCLAGDGGIVWMPNQTNLITICLRNGGMRTSSGYLLAPELSEMVIKKSNIKILAPNLLYLETRCLLGFGACRRLKTLDLSMFTRSDWAKSLAILKHFRELENLRLRLPEDEKTVEKLKTTDFTIPESVTSLTYCGPLHPSIFKPKNLRVLEILDTVGKNATIKAKLPANLEELNITLLHERIILDLVLGPKFKKLVTNREFSSDMKLPNSLSELDVGINAFNRNPGIMRNLELKTLNISGEPKGENICVKFPRYVETATIRCYDKFKVDFDFRDSKIGYLDMGYYLHHYALPELRHAKIRNLRFRESLTHLLLGMHPYDYFPPGLETLELDIGDVDMSFYKGLFPEGLQTLILYQCGKFPIKRVHLPDSLKKIIIRDSSSTARESIEAGIEVEIE